MAIVPIRGLGAKGIIKVPAPYNLPLDAWSGGNNVRFENGRVRRAPSFRTIDDTGTVDPVFMYGARPSGSNDFILYTDALGNAYTFTGVHTDITNPSFTPGASTSPTTATILDDVVYLNRNTHIPYYLLDGGSQMEPLTDFGWDATHRAGAFRTFKDYLFALDITKGANEFPNMVKWSAPSTGNGSPPASWDETDPASGAGENPLPELQGRILDGGTLKDKFIIYSNNDVWDVDFVGGTFIFDFQKLFDDEGILASGTFLEIDGAHYVWGEHDIYVHDGITKRSIVEGTNKEHIFNGMNKSLKDKFHMAYNPVLDEILFFYVANEADTAWQNTSSPNRIAAYSVNEGTWSFRDSPGVIGGAEIIYTEVLPWDSATSAWNLYGGSWDGSADTNRTALILMTTPETGAGLTGRKVYGYDTVGEWSIIPFPLDTSVTPTAYVERIGMDLDELGGEIRIHKVFDRIYPQAKIFGEPIEIAIGSQLTGFGPETVAPYLTFDPVTQYKLDFRRGGRYLSLRVRQTEPVDFWFSGADVDIKFNGRR